MSHAKNKKFAEMGYVARNLVKYIQLCQTSVRKYNSLTLLSFRIKPREQFLKTLELIIRIRIKPNEQF